MTVKPFEYRTEEEAAAQAFVDAEGLRQTEIYNQLARRGKEAALAGLSRIKEITGTEIGLPAGMAPAEAAEIMSNAAEAEGRDAIFVRDYPFRPWDGRVGTMLALKAMFGSALTFAPPEPGNFFDPGEKPNDVTMDVPIDAHGNTVAVPLGQMELRWAGAISTIQFAEYNDDKIGMAHRIIFTTKSKHKPFVVGLSKHIEDFLKEHSIYRGKTVILSNNAMFPRFHDPYKVDRSKIAFNRREWDQIRVSLISPILYPEACAKDNVKRLKQALLWSEPGTGKTLTSEMISQICNENGITVVHAKAGEDNLAETKAFAEQYAPAYVLLEDAERLARVPEGDNGNKLSKLLDELDGASGKGSEIGIIMTTNHIDEFPAAMLRAERYDVVIPFHKWERDAFTRGVSARFTPDQIEDVDWDQVWEGTSDAGFTPAFVIQILDGTKEAAIDRTKGEHGSRLTTEDFITTMEMNQPQWDLYQLALAREKSTKAPAIETAMEQLHRKVTTELMEGATFENGKMVLAVK